MHGQTIKAAAPGWVLPVANQNTLNFGAECIPPKKSSSEAGTKQNARRHWVSMAHNVMPVQSAKGLPQMENGKFVCGWHESEFQLFAAGVQFALTKH
jgi:hypothetical protein